MQEFKAGREDVGIRADVFVSLQMPSFSRSSLKDIFKHKKVLVNQSPVKPSHILKVDDVLHIDDSLLTATPPEIELEIIYEDDDVVVMNKPAGILTHAKGAINSEATVASFLSKRIKDRVLSGNRAGIVHRLDRATSGVIIGAKNAKALKYLQKQFSDRSAVKTYKAIVVGAPQPKKAIIDAPIGRNPAKPQTFKVMASGKPAQSRYEVEKVFHKNSGTFSLIELQPKTGRTHQIRIHLACINHPVVGDPVYGKGGQPMMLHAYSLSLRLPDGQTKVFTVPVPAAFKNFMEG